MSVLSDRVQRLQRLQAMKMRLIRVNGSIEAARLDPRWDTIELLIATLTSRIATSLEPSDINTPLTAAEIIFINFLLNNIKDL